MTRFLLAVLVEMTEKRAWRPRVLSSRTQRAISCIGASPQRFLPVDRNRLFTKPSVFSSQRGQYLANMGCAAVPTFPGRGAAPPPALLHRIAGSRNHQMDARSQYRSIAVAAALIVPGWHGSLRLKPIARQRGGRAGQRWSSRPRQPEAPTGGRTSFYR